MMIALDVFFLMLLFISGVLFGIAAALATYAEEYYNKKWQCWVGLVVCLNATIVIILNVCVFIK